ncbi:hypothetical protein Tco_0480753 [Tanacetum coccineum]
MQKGGMFNNKTLFDNIAFLLFLCVFNIICKTILDGLKRFSTCDEEVEDDSSKQGRRLSDAEVQEKVSTETEPIIQEVTPTEVIQDQGSSEKGNSEVSTTGATKGTASEVPVISTAEENISTAGRTVTYCYYDSPL